MRQQPELRAAVRQQLGLLARVRDVEGLDAVDFQRAEALDAGQHLAGALDVPEGVRPDGDAAGCVDGRTAAVHGGRLAQRGTRAGPRPGTPRISEPMSSIAPAASRARLPARRARPSARWGRPIGCPAAMRAESSCSSSSKPSSRSAVAMRSVRCSRSARNSAQRAREGGVVVRDAVADDVQFARPARRRRRRPRSRPRARPARRVARRPRAPRRRRRSCRGRSARAA